MINQTEAAITATVVITFIIVITSIDVITIIELFIKVNFEILTVLFPTCPSTFALDNVTQQIFNTFQLFKKNGKETN